jgi:16S rRNA G966 N2-methylase RsmD
MRKYGLNFEYKIERIPNIKLIEQRHLRLGDTDFYNIIIEGENLSAINYLKKEYLEKIDVIYIDPPYNTNVEKKIKQKCNHTYKNIV